MELFQEGCLKVRLPRPQSARTADLVVINTAGGLTGGDSLSVEVSVGAGARVTVTTPGCERIYRSSSGDAIVEQHLKVGCGGRLDWIPQETILFDRGRLRRRLDAELQGSAEITIAETILLGRKAMGETVKEALLSDRWRLRRDGRLLFVDAIHLVGSLRQAGECAALMGGHAAMASLLHVGTDLETKRDALRSCFSRTAQAMAGVSVVGDVLVARMVAPFGEALRRLLIPALAVLRDPLPLPRLWTC